jgi:hypothetical protein
MGAHRCLEDTGVGPSRAREERGDLSSRFCQLADEAREEREREREIWPNAHRSLKASFGCPTDGFDVCFFWGR